MSEPVMVPVPLADILVLATSLEAAGRRTESESLADRILAVQPLNASALHLKAIAASTRGADGEAAALLERAIAHGLENPQHYRNLCAIYERLGRLTEAATAGRRAVALDPTDAESYHNLTVVHAKMMNLERAIVCARAALALDPSRAGAHMALAEALLTQGHFAEGWAEYEWRFRLPQAGQLLPETDRPQWDGTPMPDATLLLVADQGYGDVIQFCRYLPWARTLCPNIVLAVAPELHGLVRQVAPGLPIFGAWGNCPPYAAYLAFSGLPRLHRTTLDTIPAAPAYLTADPVLRTRWAARLASLRPRGHRLVGLVWAGRAAHPNDRNRSLKLARLAPLFQVPATTFVAVQKGPALAETGTMFGAAPLINLGAEIVTFEDTAAILTELDLLVAVDTSVAHLAGALGRPAYVMLPFAPDWRWLTTRPDTPWYPTLRLFRQTEPDGWDTVVTRVAAALAHEGS